MINIKILLFTVLSFLFLSLFAFSVNAGWVNGYYRSNGTYVPGYYRSDPNGLKYDNYSWTPSQDLYNDSYYDSGYSSNWYTPSWQWQNDYWTGLDSYSSLNNYQGWYSPYGSSYDYDYNYGYDWDY